MFVINLNYWQEKQAHECNIIKWCIMVVITSSQYSYANHLGVRRCEDGGLLP